MQNFPLLQLAIDLTPLAGVAVGWVAYVVLGRRWLRGAWNMRLFS